MAQGITGSFELKHKYGWMKALVYYRQDYDISANKSVITVTGVDIFRLTSDGYYGSYYLNGSISVGGTAAISMSSVMGTHSVYISSKYNEANHVVSGGAVATGSVTVDHNADGTKSIEMSGSISSSSGSWTLSGSVTVDLTQIPRVSKPTISATSVYMGSGITIYTNRKSTLFYHKLRYTLGSLSSEIASGVADSYSWELPYSLAELIPTAASGTVTLFCDTYSDAKCTNLVGTESVQFTAILPDNDITKPSFTCDLSPSGNLPEKFAGMYIQGKTGIAASFQAAGFHTGISSCTLTVDGRSYSGNGESVSVVSSAISGSGKVAYVLAVTDNRGRKRSVSGSLDVEPYSQPKLVNQQCFRCDQSGNPVSGGTYLKVRFTREYSSLNSRNTSWVSWKYWQDGGSGVEDIFTGSDVASVDRILTNITSDPEKIYHVQFIARDDLGGVSYVIFDLPSAFHTLHLKQGGRGIAIGKASEKNAFEVAMPMYAMNGLNINGLMGYKSINSYNIDNCTGGIYWLNCYSETHLGTLPNANEGHFVMLSLRASEGQPYATNQILFAMNGTDAGKVYVRHRDHSSNAWGEWYTK